MRISEVSPELPLPSGDDPTPAIQTLQTLISDAETTPITPSTLPLLSSSVLRVISQLSHLPRPFPSPSTLLLWKLSFRLWNALVDFSNSRNLRSDSQSPTLLHHARLRHAAADLLFLAGNPPGIPSPNVKNAAFYHKAGVHYHEADEYALAAECLEKGTDLVSQEKPEERRLTLDLNLSRARTAWEVGDHNLVVVLLNRSRNLVVGSVECCRVLAEEFLWFGKLHLKGKSGSPGKFLNEALDLCEKAVSMPGAKKDEVLEVQKVKERCLRFLAAERLQAEDYEVVLKCVTILREGNAGQDEHPSTGFVAMKAWAAMGRVKEAEKELNAMVANRSVPESVCVSMAEAFLKIAGAEAAKGVLMGLLGRCRLGASAALKVVQGVVAGGSGGRAKVVAEIVSDDRVVETFAKEDAAKERDAMHAILWNYGAEHFRTKDFVIAAEMFEKSMLYIAHDEENRPRRANSYRVLCLCYLSLSQLERAQEFIDEADKLQPTVNCAFLKFKVFLQKGGVREAISQIDAIVKCTDFNPEFLVLCTHEGMACESASVATASLSLLLSLYSPGKAMPIPEVSVLRDILTLLKRNHEANEDEILRYTRRAWARMSDIGSEGFFGSGEVGNREAKWFAEHAWDIALRAGKGNRFGCCVEFLEIAAEFYSRLGESAENIAIAGKALILCVAAIIGLEAERATGLADRDLRKAMEMNDKATKILASSPISAATMHTNGTQPLIEPDFFFLHAINAYHILGRLSEDPASKQLQLIKSFVSSSPAKVCTPQNLLQFGLVASQGPRPNPEVASFALTNCLTELLATPSPDYHTVGLVLRKLIGLSAFQMEEADGGTYELYRQAYRIVVGLKSGEYPKEEGKWLAMSAWNRAGVAVRLGQAEVAIKWMKMGLDFAHQLPGMENYVSGMEECLSNFQKISGGGSKG